MTESAAQVLAEALDGFAPNERSLPHYPELLRGMAEDALSRSPELAAAISLGTAWAAAERALPEHHLFSLGGPYTALGPEMRYGAWAKKYDGDAPDRYVQYAAGYGSTPAEALRNLARALTEKQESSPMTGNPKVGTDSLRELLAAATEGPWRSTGAQEFGDVHVVAKRGAYIVGSDRRPGVDADIALIVESRNRLPALLDLWAQGEIIQEEMARFLAANRPADMGTLEMWRSGLHRALNALENPR